MQIVNKKTEREISARVAALVFEAGEKVGREIDSDDEDNIASKVASEFNVSESLVRYLGELPSSY